LVYWFADQQIDAWQALLRGSVTAGESNPRFHASRVLRTFVRLLRDLVAAAGILGYFFYGFANFPRMRYSPAPCAGFWGRRCVMQPNAAENYVPNLGYLFVILALH